MRLVDAIAGLLNAAEEALDHVEFVPSLVPQDVLSASLQWSFGQVFA